MSIRVGSTSSKNGGEIYQVSKKLEHPNYDSSTFDYDVAILTLYQPITFSNKIKPISLPKQGSKVSDGEPTLVTGWGFTEENIGKIEDHLRAVSVPIIDRAKCQKMYQYVVSSITPQMVIKCKLF